MKFARIGLVVLAAFVSLLGVCGQAPTVPDKPSGPGQAAVDSVYACTTQTTDPNGAEVAYQFDWGDNSTQVWSAFVPDGTPFVGTHVYSVPGQRSIKVRAKNSKRTSDWSEPLSVAVNPAEGGVVWGFAYTPEDPDDSIDFSLNTFGIDESRDAAYIGCEYGTVLAVRRVGGTERWRFSNRDEEEFYAAPAVGDDGTVYAGCIGDSFYAISPAYGDLEWMVYIGDEVVASAAIGLNGAVYIHGSYDSLRAVGSTGQRLWSYYTGGGISSPVIDKNGTVYVADQEGNLHSIDPATGQSNWSKTISTGEFIASPAIDDELGVIYIADDEGWLYSVKLADGSQDWAVEVGDSPSSPVIGTDHTIYIGAGSRLVAVDHENHTVLWSYDEMIAYGVVSTPAVSNTGDIYVLATAGKKKDRGFSGEVDSLYAVSAAGVRRWATPLGEGYSDEYTSAPKLDSEGNIYIGSGLAAWCIRGSGGPADSPWPMFQADARNTGRAR